MARILIVDDSPTETFRFREILTKHGYDVIEATNGFQATRQISKGKDTQHIPVVIVSTKDQATDRVWGKRQGACDYLTKPIDEQQLIDVIKQLLS